MRILCSGRSSNDQLFGFRNLWSPGRGCDATLIRKGFRRFREVEGPRGELNVALIEETLWRALDRPRELEVISRARFPKFCLERKLFTFEVLECGLT